jgi:hypothetical protein
MIKKYLIIIVFFLCLQLPCAWGEQETDWEKVYGEGLAKVSFTLRNQFLLAAGKPWHKASLDERYNFLDQLELQDQQRAEEEKKYQDKLAQLAKDKTERTKKRLAAEQARAKAIAALEHAKAEEKKAQDRKMQDIVKARIAKMKALRDAAKRRNRH